MIRRALASASLALVTACAAAPPPPAPPPAPTASSPPAAPPTPATPPGALPAVARTSPIADASPALQAELDTAWKALHEHEILDGKIDAAVAAMVKIAGSGTASPARKFLVANLIFHIDPATARRLHREAYDADPTDPSAVIELAIDEHHAGELKAAADLYDALDRGGMLESPSLAVYADCLLRLGRLAEAVKMWGRVDYAHHQPVVDRAFFSLYGPVSPWVRRAALLDRVEKGDAAAGVALVQLDLGWDVDWWNAPVNDKALPRDLELLARVKHPELAGLRLVARLATHADEPRAGVEKALAKEHFVVGGGKLPRSSVVAMGVVERVLRQRIATPEALKKRFQPELAKRCSSGTDVDACGLLAMFLVVTKDPGLKDLAASCVKLYPDDRHFIRSLLVSKMPFSRDDPDYVAGIKREPDDATLLGFAIVSADQRGERSTPEQFATFLMAEARTLAFGFATQGAHTSAAMNAMYPGLDAALRTSR